MSAIEWKLNAMINKEKSLNIRFPQKWRHLFSTRFGCYRNNIFKMNFVKGYVYNSFKGCFFENLCDFLLYK